MGAAKKKALSKDEIKQYVRDMLDSFKTDTQLQEFLVRFSGESAGTRRDVFDGVCERAKGWPPLPDVHPDQITKLVDRVVAIGPAQRPDFIERYYRALFSCVTCLGGTKSDLPCKYLFEKLVASTPEDGSTSGGAVNAALMSSLADLQEAVRGLDAVLSDKTSHKALENSFDVWSGMIPTLAAKGKRGLGLSSDALLALLNIISARRVVDSAILLALPVISSSIENLPEPYKSSIYAQKERTLRDAISHEVGKTEESGSAITLVAGDKAVETAVVQRQYHLEEIVGASEALEKILKNLDDGIAGRIGNLRSEIERVRESEGSLKKGLSDSSAARKVAEDLATQKESRIARLKGDLEIARNDLSMAKSELGRYIQSHNVLVGTTPEVERDAIDRTKRDFADNAGSVLKDIGQYLEALQRSLDADTLRLTIAGYNRLVRYLNNQGFVPASTLSKIQGLERPWGEV